MSKASPRPAAGLSYSDYFVGKEELRSALRAPLMQILPCLPHAYASTSLCHRSRMPATSSKLFVSVGNQTALNLCFNTPQISPLSECPHGAFGACDYNLPWRYTTGGLSRALLDRVGTQAANKASTSAPTLIWRRAASVMRYVKVTGVSRPGVMKPQINSSPHQISREPLDSPWEPFRVTGSFSGPVGTV